jgi:hypothetical protein
MLGRLTRLICFDRHNRFDHHDFRVMAAGTSTVWAFLVQVDYFRIARGPGTIRSLCDLHHWIFVTARYL